MRRFATAYSAADRIGASLDGLVVVILSGLALANCQLYHRFGDDGPKVLAMSRTAAAIAVATAEARSARVRKKGRLRSAPDLRRTAAEGLALATYAQAFAQHLTATREDAAAAIPLYERAIAALEGVDVEVPAVLYNNAGFQHMTVAGHFERGPDRDSYRRAQELFKKAVKVHPELHFGWANLGNLHRLQGEWGIAAICYGEALTTARQQGIAYPQGHNELAQVLVESGKAAEAEAAHRAAITLADSPSLRAKLRAEYARSLVLAGRIDDARAGAERGLAEHPGNTHCLALLADVDGDEGASA